MAAPIIYGLKKRVKLIPLPSMATISVFWASLDVKKMQAKKTKMGPNNAKNHGTK